MLRATAVLALVGSSHSQHNLLADFVRHQNGPLPVIDACCSADPPGCAQAPLCNVSESIRENYGARPPPPPVSSAPPALTPGRAGCDFSVYPYHGLAEPSARLRDVCPGFTIGQCSPYLLDYASASAAVQAEVADRTRCAPGTFDTTAHLVQRAYDGLEDGTVCQPCAAGTADLDGAPWTPCEQCPAGRFSQARALLCLPCLAGSRAAAGAARCVACAVGKYAPRLSGECAECVPGRYDSDHECAPRATPPCAARVAPLAPSAHAVRAAAAARRRPARRARQAPSATRPTSASAAPPAGTTTTACPSPSACPAAPATTPTASPAPTPGATPPRVRSARRAGTTSITIRARRAARAFAGRAACTGRRAGPCATTRGTAWSSWWSGARSRRRKGGGAGSPGSAGCAACSCLRRAESNRPEVQSRRGAQRARRRRGS